ncbi:hypothetical protein Cni_G00082 [Canna indica]|uniref:Phytocyanin domain-containing protein n=1 Tax=Canna indica TaxID=4628 RepID=A0AAQ3JM09_9LILI|nr:hypothetical protein Cni_G00082 [Canna indica]
MKCYGIERVEERETWELMEPKERDRGRGDGGGESKEEEGVKMRREGESCIVSRQAQAHLGIHIVGGSYGWKIPPNRTFYGEWAKNKTFIVGDKLVFLYTTGMENVIEGSTEEDFKYCNQNDVVDINYAGPTTVELTKPGPHYFYCGVGLHCEDGEKLYINVENKNTNNN